MSGEEPERKKQPYIYPAILAFINFAVILPIGWMNMAYTVGFWDFLFVLIGCYLSYKFIKYITRAHEHKEARVKPNQQEEIVKEGIYKQIRHPVAAGVLYMNIAYVFLFRTFALIPVLPVFFALWYILAKHKDQILLRKFGNHYKDYMQTTGMFRGKGEPEQVRIQKSGYDMY
jgi:protein-S-isoprenylcysteine O-methyltransferase Ste14